MNKEIGYKAVSLIATARNSEPLRNWLLTGEMGQKQMDLGDAYSSLQIDNETALLDEDTIDALFGARVAEAPDREEEFRQAVELIRAEMHKQQDVGGRKPFEPAEPLYPLDEWPVGLQNIGNTCYLNSLLQFFFTILPLRNMVLDIDEYMIDLADELLNNKKVGGAIIRQYEVERAQACKSQVSNSTLITLRISKSDNFLVARELRKIFSKMITAPTPEVTPDKDLARLTILKPSEDTEPAESVNTEAKRTTNNREGLGTVNGFLLHGPIYNPPIREQNEAKASAEDIDFTERSLSDDAASDVTLLNDASSGSDEEDLERVRQPEGVAFASNEARKAPASESGEPMEITNSSEANDTSLPKHTSPPSRPPPVPPRLKSPNSSNALTFGQVENIAQQRDVTEVIGNVLYQLECAIVPQRFQADGEQWDLVKE